MTEPTPIWKAAKPVHYTVTVSHYPGGSVTVHVDGIGESTSDRRKAADALRSAADMLTDAALIPTGDSHDR